MNCRYFLAFPDIVTVSYTHLEDNMHLVDLLFRRLAVEDPGDCLREAAAGFRCLLPILGGQEEDGEHPKEGNEAEEERPLFSVQ